MVQRSYGPNKHDQSIKRAQDSVSIENEGEKILIAFRLTVGCTYFKVEVEVDF